MTTKKTTKRAVKKSTRQQRLKMPIIDLDELPDSEATVEQVNNWVKFENINDELLLTNHGTFVMENITMSAKDGAVLLRANYSTNYWKYACIAILLGLVAGMIISTPFIINAVEVCSQ